MSITTRYDYIKQDLPGGDTLSILGVLPKRWGRMDRLSRLAVVEVGRALRQAGLLAAVDNGFSARGRGGLVGVTRRGSLATDLAYAETLREGPEMASPLLFSYTLPNTALAEAASHYGLTGPVYSIFSELNKAGDEDAGRWLADDRSLEFMVVGDLDYYSGCGQHDKETNQSQNLESSEVVTANFKIVS
ncbi:MAG: beta-ketoacyl synthase N-terminal-like domain-containing protein [Thermodesulfobacteriota bacterium]